MKIIAISYEIEAPNWQNDSRSFNKFDENTCF